MVTITVGTVLENKTKSFFWSITTILYRTDEQDVGLKTA